MQYLPGHPLFTVHLLSHPCNKLDLDLSSPCVPINKRLNQGPQSFRSFSVGMVAGEVCCSSYAVPTITALHRAPRITVRGSTGLLGPGSMRPGAFLSRGCGRWQAQNKGVLNKCRMFAIQVYWPQHGQKESQSGRVTGDKGAHIFVN